MADETEIPGAFLLGRYRVARTLGEGGFGTVVAAFDTRLKRTVAIKTLKRDTLAGDLDRFRMLEERFAREAEAGSRMGSHPNLVTVYDLVVDAGRTQHLILEYVAGGTLAERIAAGPLPIAEALAIAEGAARGLQAAHAHGIVHRDIKPANIFLTEEGEAKVGDFGIAQIDEISRRTHATTGHPGTPMYMSPEQASSTGYARPSSDQYSLGLVLFEMLTGKAHKRLEGPEAAALLAARPAPVRALVERMLAADPGDRHAGMAGVLAAIREAERATQVAPDAAPTDPLHPPASTGMTVRETPRVNLSPYPAVAAPPASRTVGRRAFLIGAGGLALAGGASGVAMFGLRSDGAGVATATPPAATPAATMAAAAPLSAATAIPSATGAPPATAPPIPTATTPAATTTPIVVTAPPIVITATPQPTVAPPIVITAPPIIATATPQPTAPPVAAKQAQLVGWTDRQGRMQMNFPSTWSVAPSPGQDEALDIESGDGVGMTVYISAARSDDALSGVTAYRDRQSKRTDRSYAFGPLTAGRIGGAPSQSVRCTSTSRQNPADVRVVEMHYVAKGAWLFAFECFAQGSTWRRRDEIQAILLSITLA